MRIIVLLLTFLLSFNSSGQSSYFELKEKFNGEYGEWSYDNLEARIAFLDSLRNVDLAFGREKYLLDLGTAYGWRYNLTISDHDQTMSLEAYLQCWEEFASQDALFQVMSIYAFVECSKGLKYAEVMNDLVQREELQDESDKDKFLSQISLIRQICTDQN
ncbi:MAG: hypothetical protein AB8B56_10540 [Crocinitomicaceae bacterium]